MGNVLVSLADNIMEWLIHVFYCVIWDLNSCMVLACITVVLVRAMRVAVHSAGFSVCRPTSVSDAKVRVHFHFQINRVILWQDRRKLTQYGLGVGHKVIRMKVNNVKKKKKDSLYSSSSSTFTFPVLLNRQMVPLSCFPVPSTAIPGQIRHVIKSCADAERNTQKFISLSTLSVNEHLGDYRGQEFQHCTVMKEKKTEKPVRSCFSSVRAV